MRILQETSPIPRRYTPATMPFYRYGVVDSFGLMTAKEQEIYTNIAIGDIVIVLPNMGPNQESALFNLTSKLTYTIDYEDSINNMNFLKIMLIEPKTRFEVEF